MRACGCGGILFASGPEWHGARPYTCDRCGLTVVTNDDGFVLMDHGRLDIGVRAPDDLARNDFQLFFEEFTTLDEVGCYSIVIQPGPPLSRWQRVKLWLQTAGGPIRR